MRMQHLTKAVNKGALALLNSLIFHDTESCDMIELHDRLNLYDKVMFHYRGTLWEACFMIIETWVTIQASHFMCVHASWYGVVRHDTQSKKIHFYIFCFKGACSDPQPHPPIFFSNIWRFGYQKLSHIIMEGFMCEIAQNVCICTPWMIYWLEKWPYLPV